MQQQPSRRPHWPFAARFQALLIGMLILSLVLIWQRWSMTLYHAGFVMLILAAFLQFAFGNISPTASFGRSMKLLAITWGIVIIVFALGIYLAPHLVDLGR